MTADPDGADLHRTVLQEFLRLLLAQADDGGISGSLKGLPVEPVLLNLPLLPGFLGAGDQGIKRMAGNLQTRINTIS